jgi:hypothetical protein
VYMILQLVPVLSMFFLLTSAAGSALWAVRIEEEERAAYEAHAEREAMPEAYADEPL